MNKKVLVPFTEGVEEIELMAIVDVLRRASVYVCMASLDGKAVCGRSNIQIIPDAALADVQDDQWDMIVLPGGLPNAALLREHDGVQSISQRLFHEQKNIAAICAAPVALAAFGVIGTQKVTSYPSTQEELQAFAPDSSYCDDAVVEDHHLITSRGPGTAIPFALRLVAKLCGESVAGQVSHDMVYG